MADQGQYQDSRLKPMIENSDRGITLNKSLAWTILSALAVLVWWGGSTLSQLQGSASMLANALLENKVTMTAVEVRVRALENGQSRSDSRFEALAAGIQDLKEQSREMNALLRSLTSLEGKP